MSHSDQRDERRVLPSRKKWTTILPDRLFYLKTHTKTLPVDEIFASREGQGREGYNFLSNLVQFPIVCILLYSALYFAVFWKVPEIRCILPYFESVEFGQI